MAIFQKKPIYATKSLKSLYTQGTFLKRLGSHLLEGFSLKEALTFLKTTTTKEVKQWIIKIEEGYEEGAPLYEQLLELRFSKRVCSQIYFSMTHGKFSESIHNCGIQLLSQVERRKKLNQLLNYPTMLIIFMIGMLLSMRYILLPHIKDITAGGSSDLFTRMVLSLIESSPLWLSGFLAAGILIFMAMKIYLRNKTALEKTTVFASIPFFNSLYQLFMTQYFSFEWSQLLSGGSSLREIVSIMKDSQTSQLVNEVGGYLEKELMGGREFNGILTDFKFLKKEMGEIVIHGSSSGNLDKELRAYSQQCEEELQINIDKTMQWIQPIVFSAIALMIISIYASILLPTFSLLEGL